MIYRGAPETAATPAATAVEARPPRQDSYVRHLALVNRLKSVHGLVWLWLLVLLCLLPFIDKAFFTDDTLFLRAAQQIQKHPLDFYGFNINWFGYTTTMTEAFENPPLTSYYIALAAWCFGWGERALHLAFLPIALFAVWGVFKLAACYCERPLLAAGLAMLTPAFLISATSVMCDVMLLAFWVWALFWFERALRSHNWSFLLLSGCLAGLAFLTKYPGVNLIPLMIAYGALHERRLGRWLIGPTVPLLVVGGYELLTHHLYGTGLLASAGGYASHFRNGSPEVPWEKLLLGIIFLGGSLAPALFYAPLVWSRRVLLFSVCGLPLSLLVIPRMAAFSKFLWAPDGGLGLGLLFFATVLALNGIQIMAVACSDLWKRRNATSLMLFLWVAGVFVFTIAINWTINARSLLPAVPAVGILLARQLSSRFESGDRPSWRAFLLAGSTALVLVLFLLNGDADLANAERSAANELIQNHQREGRPIWFRGNSGFQYYAERLGGKPLDLKSPQVSSGDPLVSQFDTQDFTIGGLSQARLLGIKSYPLNRFCVTLSDAEGAGFYASVRRPFPFAPGPVHPKEFGIYEVRQVTAQADHPPHRPTTVLLSRAPDGNSSITTSSSFQNP
jgi:4-amino-4-deoxy-L-arabinose transferase-like glycosyltransferase